MPRKKKKEETAADKVKGALKRIGKAGLKGAAKGAKKYLKKKLLPKKLKGNGVLSRDVYLIAQGMLHRWYARTLSGFANEKGGPADFNVGRMLTKKEVERVKGHYLPIPLREDDSKDETEYADTWDGKIPSLSEAPPEIETVEAPPAADGSFLMFKSEAEAIFERIIKRVQYKAELALRRRPSYRHWLMSRISGSQALEALSWSKGMLGNALMWSHTRRGPQIISTRKKKRYGQIKFGGRSGFRRGPGRPRRQENWQQSPL